MEINAKMLAKALWETGSHSSIHGSVEKWDDLDETSHRWQCQNAQTVLDAIQKDRTPGEVGFDNYVNLVATVYGIEGQQIKPNDPRLQLPDNRCPLCVATMNEPQVLTPVRRQVHEKLQTGWHMQECPHRNAGDPTVEEVRRFNRGGDGS